MTFFGFFECIFHHVVKAAKNGLSADVSAAMTAAKLPKSSAPSVQNGNFFEEVIYLSKQNPFCPHRTHRPIKSSP